MNVRFTVRDLLIALLIATGLAYFFYNTFTKPQRCHERGGSFVYGECLDIRRIQIDK